VDVDDFSRDATLVDETRVLPATRPAQRHRARVCRSHRWLGRIWKVLVAVVVLAAGTFGALLVFTPSVSTAPARVQAILAANHAPSDGGVVPAKVGEAVLATEDSRFHSDPAVDPRGVLRGSWGAVTGNSGAGGATIEVQLAKMLYTPGSSDPLSVFEQVALAFKLDQHFTKTQILAMYLDAAYFGDGAYGITQAASHYFGVPADQLTWGQASLLAGLVQAPSSYDPHGHLTLALQRRQHVLNRLVAVGTLTHAQAEQVAAAPLNPVVPFSG
jgi:membrane peptidoglycan carboxypeptidase